MRKTVRAADKGRYDMRLGTLVRAARAAETQGRLAQAARLLAGAASRTDNDRQRFTLTETAYELARAA